MSPLAWKVKRGVLGLVLALQQAWGFGGTAPALIRCPAPGAAAHPRDARLRGSILMKAGKTAGTGSGTRRCCALPRD